MVRAMRPALCCLLVSGVSSVAGSSKSKGAGIDLGGLSSALKHGGAQGLLSALNAMGGMKHDDATYKIKKDENGEPMYDFVDETTTTTTPLPVTMPPTTKAPLPPPLPLPAAAATPVAVQPAVMAATPAQVPMVAIPQMPMFAAGANGGGFLANLATGLAAMRQQADVLSAEVNAAAGGAAVAQVSSFSASSAQNAAVSKKVEEELQSMEKRIYALEGENKKLEGENKKLHQQVDDQGKHLEKVDALQKSEEKEVATLTAQDNELRQALAKRHLRRKRKAAQDAAAESASGQ